MCFMTGRRPHELAADIILDAIREAQHDHETQELIQARRPSQDQRRRERPWLTATAPAQRSA
jgi:hypothetical protein